MSQNSPTNELVLAKYRESNLSVLKLLLNDQRFCTGDWIVKEVSAYLDIQLNNLIESLSRVSAAKQRAQRFARSDPHEL